MANNNKKIGINMPEKVVTQTLGHNLLGLGGNRKGKAGNNQPHIYYNNSLIVNNQCLKVGD